MADRVKAEPTPPSTTHLGWNSLPYPSCIPGIEDSNILHGETNVFESSPTLSEDYSPFESSTPAPSPCIPIISTQDLVKTVVKDVMATVVNRLNLDTRHRELMSALEKANQTTTDERQRLEADLNALVQDLISMSTAATAQTVQGLQVQLNHVHSAVQGLQSEIQQLRNR